MIYSDVKSYRAALTGYRMNLLNSIPTLLQKRLPMSLVLRDSLMKILDYVAREQMNAKVVPMQQKGTGSAIRWKIESPYLAVSEDSMETAVLSKDQLEKCLGSSSCRICH